MEDLLERRSDRSEMPIRVANRSDSKLPGIDRRFESSVIPANAGIHRECWWIPAFARMTNQVLQPLLKFEVPNGFEPLFKVLQTFALPLGYRAEVTGLFAPYRVRPVEVNSVPAFETTCRTSCEGLSRS